MLCSFLISPTGSDVYIIAFSNTTDRAMKHFMRQPVNEVIPVDEVMSGGVLWGRGGLPYMTITG
jgi:hypothetical protein